MDKKLNQLIPIKNAVSLPFKPTTGELYYNEPNLSRLGDEILDEQLTQEIAKLYMKCGYKLDAETLESNILLFKQELEAFGHITLTELKKAFKNGFREQYGDYTGLSVRLLVRWVKTYIKNDRNADLHKLKPKTNEMPEMTQEEKDNLLYTGTLNAFEKYKQDSNIVDGYAWLYEHLIDLKLLNPTNQQRKSYYEKAVKFLKEEAAQQLPDRRKSILEKLEVKRAPIAITRAKIMLVENYFATLLAKNDHIKNHLK